MAGLYNDDESTDDELGMNLLLAERLSINRGESSNCKEDENFENSKDFKQLCNMRRKQYAQEGQSSSSSSLETQNGDTASVLMCPDLYHNKKRQNGDKNTEQLARPKRTCLSDRFNRSPDWRELKKKKGNNYIHQPESSALFRLKPKTSPDLFPDKKNDRVNGLNNDDDSDSDFQMPIRKNRRFKKSFGESSKSSNHCLPSTSVQKPLEKPENKPSTSYFNKFLETSSEDESKPVMQNGALKGGRQDLAADRNCYSRKLFSRKLSKKLLDSDESDEISATAYRSRPLIFSSSDSDDFRDIGTKSKSIGIASNESAGHSHLYSGSFDKNTSHHSRQHKPLRANQKNTKKPSSSNRADSSEGCDHQFISSDFQRKNVPHRSCRSRRSPRINITSNLTSNGFANSNSISGPVRGSRITGADRGGRRSSSPHHRCTRYQHKSEDSKCCGRSVSSARFHKEMPSYAVRFPDVFDAEETENEYFTANSYSDTETSTQSLGGLTINTTFPRRGGAVSCTLNCENHLFEDGTTDDEISVVFSSGPYGRSNESNRGLTRAETEIDIRFPNETYGRNPDVSRNAARADEEISVIFSTSPYARNNDSRRGGSRTLGRRHSRGTHRQFQNAREVVSLSPDPVEQVRQMEEDERMARMLQAQFDAETHALDEAINAEASFIRVNHGNIDLDDSDEEDEDEIIDPVGDSDSDEPINTLPNTFSRFPISRRGFGNRIVNRSESPIAIFLNNQRSRRRPHFQPQPRRPEGHFHRIFGLSSLQAILGEEDDYEALLSLDLDSDVYRRGLSASHINRLPTRKYVHPNSAAAASSCEITHKRTELNKECQVCLSDYETGDVLRILPCFHEFHTPCIDPWLKINHTCPVCRVTVDLSA